MNPLVMEVIKSMVMNDDFLMKVYEDVTSEMRCRRNFESQLVHYYFLFYSLIGIAIVTLFDVSKDRESLLFISRGIAMLIAIITFFFVCRIIYDHKKYTEFGQIAVRIWKYFDMFTSDMYLAGETIIPDKFEDHGKGIGYFYTYVQLLLMAAGMCIVLGILVSVK